MVAAALKAHPARAGIVAPGHAPAVLRQQIRKLAEGGLNVVDVPVVVQVILVDVGDHGHCGLEVQKALPELASLAEEVVAVALAGAAADEIQLAADVNRGIGAGGEEALGQHGCCRGLAVGAADADGEAVARHQLADQVAALDLGNAQARSFRTFDIFGGDRGGVDDHVRAVHVLRLVADVNLDALLREVVGLVGAGLIRAADDVTLLLEQARQTGHRAAANADKVDATPLEAVNIFNHAANISEICGIGACGRIKAPKHTPSASIISEFPTDFKPNGGIASLFTLKIRMRADFTRNNAES